MSEKTVTRLQAMYHSGQLSEYLVSKSPDTDLVTGWIEQGLLSKGLSGNLQDKKNQENLVIPVDRFVRLVSDIESEIDKGLFILGGHSKSKHITMVSKSKSKKSESMDVIGLNSGKIKTSELLETIARFVTTGPDSKEDDPNLDYIEELVSDAANGDITQLLSLSLKSGKQNTANWVKNILKTDLTSDVVLAKSGKPSEISQTILFLSRWLLGLDLFRRTKNVIASIILVQNQKIVICLWDSNHEIVTFAISEGLPTNIVLRKYIHPLWYTSSEVSEDESTGPKVVIEKTKKRSLKSKTKPSSVSPSSQSITIVRAHLTELNSRFSALSSHVSGLKKRITKLTKDTRFQSMSEHSNNAIEELHRIEKETKILEDISKRLREMEKQIESAGTSGSSKPQLSSDEIQNIVSKMSALRALMDKIDVELGQLDSQVSEIESLKFKHRTES